MCHSPSNVSVRRYAWMTEGGGGGDRRRGGQRAAERWVERRRESNLKIDSLYV